MVFTILFILISTCFISAADVVAVQNGNWSDASTWSGGQIPGQGDDVLIDSGFVVIYDMVSSEAIHVLHLRGTLEFSRTTNTQLDVGMIILTTDTDPDPNADCSVWQHGPDWNDPPPALEVGTQDNPIPGNVQARIRLVYFEDLDPDCAPGIITYGGRMDFHGAPLNKTWVKLAEPVPAGSNTVTLAENVNWKVGDRIVLTSTTSPGTNYINVGSFRENDLAETEERFISAVNGNTITLDTPVEFLHRKTGDLYVGEVANLSRNVVIETRDTDGPYGHTLYHYGSSGSISYAEFAFLGKEGVLARYPIHYHVVRETMRGSSVVGASIRESGNRFITVHATDFLVVRDNVGYKGIGHGYFLEDASEAYNLFHNNIAILAYEGEQLPNQALEYDLNEGSGYWIPNALNAFIDNVAAECDQYGFRLDIPDDIYANVLQPDGTTDYMQVSTLPFIRFRGFESHSNALYGVRTNGSATENEPHVLEDIYVWKSWYAIEPDGKNTYIKDLHIRNVAYGFYGTETHNVRVEGFTSIHNGNYTMGFRYRPEGLITFEDVYVDSLVDHPFRIMGIKERDLPADVHVRDYTLLGFEENGLFGADETGNPMSSPELTLYLHDFYGNNQDAKVIPSTQSRNDGLVYGTESPPHHEDVQVAHTSVPWPEPVVVPIDSRPPASVIVYPAHNQEFDAGTSEITVRGTSIDASTISTLTVNGVDVTPLEENYLRWSVNFDNLEPGIHTFTARATDEYGNVEVHRHEVKIGVGQSPTAIGDKEEEIDLVSTGFELVGNYPNPFNPETRIRFNIPQNVSYSFITLHVYDISGREVKKLFDGTLTPGAHERVWNATDKFGNPVSTGVYLYEIIARDQNGKFRFRDTKKMLLVR